MPPENFAVDGQGGYVFSPPEGEVPPPAQLSDRDLAEKAEFEAAAAAAAGLTPEQFSETAEGRAKGDEIGRRTADPSSADCNRSHRRGPTVHKRSRSLASRFSFRRHQQLW